MPFPVAIQRIEAAERALGRRLPDPIRNRLLRNNGGEILCDDEPWQLHPVWDDTDRGTAARTASHIVHETNEARQWANFPEEAIAIASDGSGNLLVLRGNSNQVEVWSHEEGECESVTIDCT